MKIETPTTYLKYFIFECCPTCSTLPSPVASAPLSAPLPPQQAMCPPLLSSKLPPVPSPCSSLAFSAIFSYLLIFLLSGPLNCMLNCLPCIRCRLRPCRPCSASRAPCSLSRRWRGSCAQQHLRLAGQRSAPPSWSRRLRSPPSCRSASPRSRVGSLAACRPPTPLTLPPSPSVLPTSPPQASPPPPLPFQTGMIDHVWCLPILDITRSHLTCSKAAI